MKKALKVALYILLALVLIVLAYVIYVFAAYYRVEDMQKLGVAHCDAASAAPMEGAPQTGVTYRVSSANVGFGAYSADYSFFMDGGKESRARSRQAVDENMRGEVSLVKDLFARLCALSGGRYLRHAQLAHRRGRLSRRCDGKQRI